MAHTSTEDNGTDASIHFTINNRKDRTMFKITVTELCSHTFYIDAETEEEARAKFTEDTLSGKLDWSNGEVINSETECVKAIKQFEVGKAYRPTDAGFDPVTVIKRTSKCIFVRGSAGNEWRMVVRNDGNREFVTDSCVPKKWRFAFTYFADNEA